MRKKILGAIAIGALCLLSVVGLYRRAAPQDYVRFDSGYRVIMGTFARVVVLAASEQAARQCAQAAFDRQRRIDELMSYHNADSELNRVNRRAFGEPVQVGADTFEVLRRAKAFSELSGGAFDVTIGALGDLWRRAGDANQPPTDAEIAAAQSKTGYEKLRLDPDARTVRFAVEGMKLDLGGIAKGYAIDKSVEAMKQGGAVGGMVDIGGDVLCFGAPPPGKESWAVGLQDPTVAPDDLAANKLLLILKVTDAAVTTSGDYRRFTEVQGERQSHIMDRESGRGAGKLVSVTIIAPDAAAADALATAVSVLGAEKGLALIEQVPNTEAILIPNQKDPQPVFSTGARAYVR
jgi:thiamine biosynthesis lipoprotein